MLPSSEKNRLNAFLKYSGMSFQMGATLVVLGAIGYYTDKYLHVDKPYFTLIFLLLGTFLAIYSFVKRLSKTS